jgi:serine/threonine protein kinase
LSQDPFRDELQSALAPAYTIQRELTGGGMSRVFVALEHALGRTVVVKVLKPELGAGVNRERFRREIMLAAQLQHPHIVPVLSAGEHDDLLWYTMPFVEGVSLRDSLAHVGKFSPRTVTRVLHDVLDALAYAHRRGVIHRDIKPGNILHHGSHSLVTDFGVAKALSASLPHSGTTSVGIAIGTPAYMAPEQLAADPTADHRMDLYAVGLLAYELLTGVQPFSGDSPQETMAAQLTRMPAPLEEVCPEVSPGLASLVMRLLAKSPNDRPATAAAALAELESFTTPSGAPVSASQGSTATAGAPPSGERTPAPMATPRSWKRAIPAAGVVLIVALIGALLMVTNRGRVPAGDSSHLTTTVAPAGQDSSPSTSTAPPAVRLTHGDSLRIADAVRQEMIKARRADVRQSGGVPNFDSLQETLVRAYTDSMMRQARRALDAVGLPLDTHVAAAESLAAKMRARVERGGVAAPARPPRSPTITRITRAPQATPLGRFTRPRRVAILPVRNTTARPELGSTARALEDSLRAALAVAGYTAASDAELLRLMSEPDMNAQRRLADSIGIGAVVTNILATRGDEIIAQAIVLDVWRNFPLSERTATDLDKPRESLGLVRDVMRALERVSWRSRSDPKRVLFVDLVDLTGMDSLTALTRQISDTLRDAIAKRLGVQVVTDSQSGASRDANEWRAAAARVGAGAIVAASVYRIRNDSFSVRLLLRDMSEDRSYQSSDVRLPRRGALQQLGPLVETLVAQLSQVNWGPKGNSR